MTHRQGISHWLQARWVRLLPLAGALYAVMVVVVAKVSYSAELAKLNRGAFTDTFSPTMWLELVTLPGSTMVEHSLPTYPVAFNAVVYGRVVHVRTVRLLEIGLLQALVLTAVLCIVALWSLLRVRRGADAAE